ncbi:hypothetical protein [Streptomyces rimosus]|uniref:hypothetical protein n=1 Tax=Streptomyces rimosus TaxID=1927 RepID=UPI0013316EA7|nr:hypothetical protein [Streptomyces rimosus]
MAAQSEHTRSGASHASSGNNVPGVQDGVNRGLGRLIGVGVSLAGLLLIAVGVYVGPYSVWVDGSPGKITVEACATDYHYANKQHSGNRTRDIQCYGTFRSDDGRTKDLNASVDSWHKFKEGDLIEVRQVGRSSYVQHSWNRLANGVLCLCGGLVVLVLGVLCTVTGYRFRGAPSFDDAWRSVGAGVLRTLMVGVMAAGLIGAVLSGAVLFFT